ncbi:MAG: enoyl-CoA hydratase/isomerase family protein [Gammaproteobacteria bacterium]|nr:enoyl-CoA hydratase/isomerase family protein [Gammaproteobacteria bacterium]
MQVIELPGVEHWRLHRDDDKLLWLALDCAGASTNTLSAAVLGELAVALDAASEARPRGLVLHSAKPNGFAAGADIRAFDDMLDPDQTARQIDEVHALFARLENLPFPTVARVHGFCLGGGLELALACRHVVADDASATRLGFPEILLGIHPGFGGTVRSIRQCGALAALDLMLTGRAVNARRARALGLVDRAVPRRHLDAAARHFAGMWHTRREPAWWKQAVSHGLLRPLTARALRHVVARKAPEQHYPAPYALLRLWARHGGDETRMYRAEARSIAELLTTSTSRNLVRLFMLQERLKGFGREAGKPIRHVHVVGAGTMGGDIAAWCALRGLQVTLQDRGAEYLGGAVRRAHRLFERRVRDRYERLAARDRLVVDLDGHGIGRADVVIEAIVEDVAAKRALFRAVEAQARPDALLATNTSSIELGEIAAALDDPARLVGVHFFNPVAQMQLVEIVSGGATRAAVAARAAAFVAAIDRLPLPAQSAPGFLVNRVLSPYLQEAFSLLAEGVDTAYIDETARAFGMPMGPLELADTVGLDICLHVGEILAAAFGGEVPGVLREQVTRGRLGVKSKAGFYEHGKRRRPAAKGRRDVAAADVRDRLVLRMVNEAVACLREGIVADADLVDVGMVFGTGFAPFRGGPLNYARERGVSEVLTRLRQLEAQHGARFAADSGWDGFGRDAQ